MILAMREGEGPRLRELVNLIEGHCRFGSSCIVAVASQLGREKPEFSPGLLLLAISGPLCPKCPQVLYGQQDDALVGLGWRDKLYGNLLG